MSAAIGLKTYIWNNNLKSMFLLAGFPFLLLIMLWAFFAGISIFQGGDGITTKITFVEAGNKGVMLFWDKALLVSAIWFIVAFLFHQSMINAATGAKPVSRNELPEVYNLLENLCISRGIKTPRLYVIESQALNAYASGINEGNYSVTLTTGIIDALDKPELEAVIGHELTHIMNNDVRLLIVGVIFVGMISFLCEMAWRNMRFSSRSKKGAPALALVAAAVFSIGYLLALVIRFSISRRREYMADAGSVELTKNPEAMISALRKISGNAEMKHVPAEVRHMFIENTEVFSLFSTHPPIEKRIRMLEEIAGIQSVAPEIKSGGPWG